MIWDEQARAYKDSVGLVWNESARAWEERWGGVTAYVYGAALETIAIKRNGVTVGQVSTDTNGKSTEQIRLACGTYDLTGSVSGWTETQTVDRNTERFRAMPEGALYWYGNECTDVTGGFRFIKGLGMYANNNVFEPYNPIYNTNYVSLYPYNANRYSNMFTSKKITLNSGNRMCCSYKQITKTYNYEPMLPMMDDSNYANLDSTKGEISGSIGTQNTSYGEYIIHIDDVSRYLGVEANGVRKVEIFAFWIEP